MAISSLAGALRAARAEAGAPDAHQSTAHTLSIMAGLNISTAGITLGGRDGTAVTNSTHPIVSKGWKLTSIGGRPVSNAEAALHAARKLGRPYAVTFEASDKGGSFAQVLAEAQQKARREGEERREAAARARRETAAKARREEEERARAHAEDEARKEAARRAAEQEAAAVARRHAQEEEIRRLQEEKEALGRKQAGEAAQKEAAQKEAAQREAAQKEAARKAMEVEAARKRAEEKQEVEQRRKEEERERKQAERQTQREEQEKRQRADKEQERARSQADAVKVGGGLSCLPRRDEVVAEPQQLLLQAMGSSARAPVVKKSGPCDKCDGDHHSDDCPHFKKSRDEHADAWVGYDKGGGKTDGCASASPFPTLNAWL